MNPMGGISEGIGSVNVRMWPSYGLWGNLSPAYPRNRPPADLASKPVIPEPAPFRESSDLTLQV